MGQTIVNGILMLLAGAVIVVTFLPLSDSPLWWVQAAAFPRIQLAVLATVIGVALLVVDHQSRLSVAMAIALGLAIVWQLVQIYPYTGIASKETLAAASRDGGRRLRLLTSNIYMENRNVQAFLDTVRRWNPDVILVCEPDQWWEERLRVIEKDYPYTIKEPLDNTYGMLLYSRRPLEDGRVEYLVEDSIPSITARIRLGSGDDVQLHCIHPRPPVPQSDTEERDAELVLVGRRVREEGGPAIIIGDFNDVAWSRTTELFQNISGTLDPRKGRGLYNTFNAHYFFLRFPLDHVFHTNHFRLVRLERLGDIGSDHFPILAELSFEPERRSAQPAPRADQEDHKEGVEKMGKAREKVGDIDLR